MAETTDDGPYVGARYVSLARLDLMQNDIAGAKKNAAAAAPFLQQASADPYQKRELQFVNASLARLAR